ncbi:MAG: hypothetical protein IJ480_11995 [Clostridia bacterium]|nr:hypothetical protein [Clostridia bacterium]
MHLKDFIVVPSGTDVLEKTRSASAPVGTGNLCWSRILSKAAALGVTNFVVEDDMGVLDPFESAALFCRNLKKMSGEYKIMKTNVKNLMVCWEKGVLGSLTVDGRELLAANQKPLFALRLRDEKGDAHLLSAAEGKCTVETVDGGVCAVYTGFTPDVTVKLTLREEEDGWLWRMAVENRSDMALEWADMPAPVMAGPLCAQGGDGRVFWPYNEGVLVDDGMKKNYMIEPEYPSQGNYAMFPNMVFAQFMLYLYGDGGLYMGLEDPARGLKDIDFRYCADGIWFRNRVFCGGDFGADWENGFDLVWRFFDGDWMDGAELYRSWFTANLPEGLVPMQDNKTLPSWYSDMPLVVTYPVRGIHDMDKMDPNGFFPYVNALPYLEDISEKTDSRLLVLLMHWEGTAPWAPPYVWPPYGGEEGFNTFMNRLHEKGHLLGVYCSGLGWTEQSNLIESYNTEKRFAEEHLETAMCTAPDGSLPKSKICTGQRSGYDLCPASDKAQEILTDALTPLLKSGVDYVQVMDQNHGGGMYLCYSRDHGHPPMPGPWMIDTMQKTLRRWKAACPDTLLGCESAAAEPFLASLGLSDNRFELNYAFGRPVPAYAYLYHTYLYNFMGNQVCCPFTHETTGLCYRLAYAASAGDLLTLVLNDAGEVEFYWGMRDFSRVADKESILRFIADWREWQKAYPDYLRDGQMIHGLAYDCETTDMPMKDGSIYTEKSVLSSAWTNGNGRKGQFFINYTDHPVLCRVGGIPAGAVWHLTGADSRPARKDDCAKVPAYGMCLLEWDA